MKKIFFILGFAATCTMSSGQIAVQEGPDAVYVFLSDRRLSDQEPHNGIKGVRLYRAAGDQTEYTPLGRVQAVATRQEFDRVAGEGVLTDIRKLKGLDSEAATWDYVTKHPELSDYGAVILNTDFSVAMGAVYKDVDIVTSDEKTVRYRADFIGLDDNIVQTVEETLVRGTLPAIEKPVLNSLEEGDSTIVVSWGLKYTTSPDAFWGQVWVREKANAAFQPAGYALADRGEDGELIVFKWRQEVKPGLSYGFYIVPQTLVRLPGPSSDTVSAISRNFSTIARIPIAFARDSLGGIHIAWNTLEETVLFSGIVVERSKDPEKGFIPIDTIPAASDSYFDIRVLPNVLYHYRFRMLDIRQNLSAPSAYVSHSVTLKNLPIEAPERVRLAYDEAGHPAISWKPVASPEVSGYQVFRAVQGKDDFELISNLLQDSVFVDSTIRDSRAVYQYAVRALNYENKTSELSAIVFGSPGKVILPVTPYDVQTYSEPGKITLRWKEMISYDEYIRGYSVYRKMIAGNELPLDGEFTTGELISAGFEKISDELITEVVFADRAVTPGGHYAYAVTATDLFGVEGKALGTRIAAAPVTNLRAPEIHARVTGKGIEITWDDVLVPDVDRYVIFVRLPSERQPRKLAEVAAGQETYADTSARAGQLYFYSMKIGTMEALSEAGTEKSVRK